MGDRLFQPIPDGDVRRSGFGGGFGRFVCRGRSGSRFCGLGRLLRWNGSGGAGRRLCRFRDQSDQALTRSGLARRLRFQTGHGRPAVRRTGREYRRRRNQAGRNHNTARIGAGLSIDLPHRVDCGLWRLRFERHGHRIIRLFRQGRIVRAVRLRHHIALGGRAARCRWGSRARRCGGTSPCVRGRGGLCAGDGSLRACGGECCRRCACLPLRGGACLRAVLPDSGLLCGRLLHSGLLCGGFLHGRIQRNVNIERSVCLRNGSRFPQNAAALLHRIAGSLRPGRGAPALLLLTSAPKEGGKPSFFFPFFVSAGHPSHLTFPISLLRPRRAPCEKKSRPAVGARAGNCVLYINRIGIL